MRLRRVLITVRRIQRQRTIRRDQAFHDEVDEALTELREIGRRALILNDGRRQAPRPSSASRRRILLLVLARRKTQLYLVIASILIAVAWFVIGESRGSCAPAAVASTASTGAYAAKVSPEPSAPPQPSC